MRVRLSLTNFSWPHGQATMAGRLGDIARVADEGGLDTMWVADHLIQADPMSDVRDAMPEAYTTLGYLAARTERIRLGTMVTAVTFRPASLLIKTISTLDVLSGGRAWLGIGAGYAEEEARWMGVRLPAVAERFERLEETVQLGMQMWAGDESPFEGRQYQLERPLNFPNALRRPHPPILIGGTGERRTLRLVAEYADACNLFDIPDGGQTLRHKLAVLAEHCEAVGRPYEQIDKTVSTLLQPGESVESFTKRCAALAAWGIKHVVVITRGLPWSEEAVRTLVAAADQLRDAGTNMP